MVLEKNTIKKKCIQEIKKEWQTTGDSFPDFLHEFSDETQKQNEQYLQTVLDDFHSQMNSLPINPMRRKKWRQKTLDMLHKVLSEETILDTHHFMDHRMIDAFQEETSTFCRHARTFAPELTFEGIGQAARNYVVYAMFNGIHRVETGFSQAAFGYSMLYPFTDNFIDDAQKSDIEKREYNQLIRDKIEGKKTRPKSTHQVKTCELLQMIVSEYPKDADPAVTNLLLMMLEAQEDSLRQQNRQSVLTMEERLDISLYKGGISVLIDRLLVKKEMTDADLRFYFGFGFFLQLADDLQDIKPDSVMANHAMANQTLFTGDFHSGQEERTVNKMFHFIHRLTSEYKAENEPFKEFILRNCYLLICSSTFQSREFFSKEYMDRLQSYFPVSYPFFESLRRNQPESKNSKMQDSYLKLMDVLIS